MNKIQIDKQYAYRNGEPARILCVDGNREQTPVICLTQEGFVTVHTSDGSAGAIGHVSPYDLIEIPEAREPREWVLSGLTDAYEGPIIGLEEKGIRVREVPAPSEIPEVGARLRFTKIPFAGIEHSQKVGDEITVEEVTTDGFSAGEWEFGKDWRDGLELVTEPETPEVEEKTAPYPPPESEWPEKPDPGPGMVWERIWNESGDESVLGLLEDEGDAGNPLRWFNIKGWSEGTLVFKAVPAPQDPAHECTEKCKIVCDQKEDPAESAARDALEPERKSAKDAIKSEFERVAAMRGDYAFGYSDGLTFAIKTIERADAPTSGLVDALKEAEAGLEAAIAVISKELSDRDCKKSSPRLALEIVKKALAENGGEQ